MKDKESQVWEVNNNFYFKGYRLGVGVGGATSNSRLPKKTPQRTLAGKTRD